MPETALAIFVVCMFLGFGVRSLVHSVYAAGVGRFLPGIRRLSAGGAIGESDRVTGRT